MDEEGEFMHVVTIQFAIVLDGEVPLTRELAGLVASINMLYDDPNLSYSMPAGSWSITSVGPKEDHRDLDPCFNGNPPIPGWPGGTEAKRMKRC